MSAQAVRRVQADGAKTGGGNASWRMKLAWVVLVGVVPLLATLAMLGIALQVVGVPVWSTAARELGWGGSGERTGHSVDVRHAQTTSPRADLRRQVTVLKAANRKLSAELESAKARAAALQDRLQAAQAKLSAASSSGARYKREASILSAMDPGKAAQVLAKLPAGTAVHVLAQMAPADVADILSRLAPSAASQMLWAAAGKG